jgi:hypothetical protein
MRKIALVLIALCCCVPASAAVGGNVITVGGRIGPLQIDKSSRTDVIAYAGKPDAEVKERVLGFPNYDALGYECSPNESVDALSMGNNGPFCRTIYIVDVPSKKLEDFFTSDSRFREARGVRIGTAASVAERLLRTKIDRNCLTVLKVESPTANLRINFTGGRADAFALHSPRRTSGLFHCMA